MCINSIFNYTTNRKTKTQIKSLGPEKNTNEFSFALNNKENMNFSEKKIRYILKAENID